MAITFGVSELPALTGVWLTLAGVLGLIVFIRWEMRLEHPVFNIAFFRENTVFRFSNLAALINYSAIYAVAFLISLYLQVH